MVVFSIKAKAGLANGTVIKNRAGIYFDDNPVVMNDYAQNNFPFPSVFVNSLSTRSMRVYPNPVTDVLHIDAGADLQSAQLLNSMGQIVIEQRISGKTDIDVHTLPAGIYYLQLQGASGTQTQKIEKQ
jgi:hypothetical protein